MSASDNVASNSPIGARSVGTRVQRAEDPRILTGQGRYLDDVEVPGVLHAAFMRSSVPHALLTSVDASAARELPGVVAVYTGEDMQRLCEAGQGGAVIGMNLMPGMKSPKFFGLATDKVRFVGDPIAMVVAENRYIAEDAVEAIVEDYEILDPVVTYEHALDPERPALFDDAGDNIAFEAEMVMGDIDGAFAEADRVVTATISVHRHQPVPMETRGTIADWDPEAGRLTVRTSTQSPHMVRMLLAPQIRLDMENIRVLADDVGGGFGLKNGVFREDVCIAAASIDLARPVKWAEDRSEHLLAAGHAREEYADVEVAVTNDGVILGVRMDVKLNSGAYPSDPFPGAMYVGSVSASFQGPLAIKGLASTSTSVFSNKASYVAYRGPWASADFMRERMLDVVARELGIEPIDIRRRNYAFRDEEPLTMLNGTPYSGITTQESIEKAAELIDWDDFRARQAAALAEGRYIGLGIASYLEAAPGPRTPGVDRTAGILGPEVSHVSVEADGRIAVITQQQPHGQGHETTLAQVASDELGVAFEDITVRYGDTDFTPVALVATGGSRAATMANGSVLHASRGLRDKVLSIAAELLEASAADLEIDKGVISVKGTPTAALSFADLASAVAAGSDRLPEDLDTDLTVTHTYDGGEGGWSGGTHCVEVEVNLETGMVDLQRYVVVEDCGVPVNPAIVEGQVRGGIAQAIGAVFLEHAAYDEDGQNLAGSFMDYLLPTITSVPRIEIHHLETIPLDDDVNFRGVGEGGMIVAPAALTNAIEDALAPLGAEVREQHLPPQRILELAGLL
jgi:aerobic carbon-monoxide dehydrogenase large subunit